MSGEGASPSKAKANSVPAIADRSDSRRSGMAEEAGRTSRGGKKTA